MLLLCRPEDARLPVPALLRVRSDRQCMRELLAAQGVHAVQAVRLLAEPPRRPTCTLCKG